MQAKIFWASLSIVGRMVTQHGITRFFRHRMTTLMISGIHISPEDNPLGGFESPIVIQAIGL